MSGRTDKILDALSRVPDNEKPAAKKFFNTLLRVAIKHSPSSGYANGTTEYVNKIYLAYLSTFYASKTTKRDLLLQLQTRGVLIEAIDKNITLVAVMDAEQQNEAKDMWKSIAITSMKNLGYGYKYGTDYHINHQILNYLELYCGVNMSKELNSTNSFGASNLYSRIGA